jgi:hypothetical protein
MCRLFVCLLAIVVPALTATSALLATPAAADEGWQCADRRVDVTAPSRASAAIICDQADKARAFLAGCGIEARHPLSVRVTRDLSKSAGWRKSGDFDASTGRVRLLPFLSYLRVSKQKPSNTLAFARVMHASIAAHEIAHGIFHERSAHLDLPETAHEYVAYVVQFATLPPDLQKSLSEQDDLPAVTNLFMFSFFLLRADPERFALNAYRHFHQPENGCGFLHRVLESRVHFPPPSD